MSFDEDFGGGTEVSNSIAKREISNITLNTTLLTNVHIVRMLAQMIN